MHICSQSIYVSQFSDIHFPIVLTEAVILMKEYELIQI